MSLMKPFTTEENTARLLGASDDLVKLNELFDQEEANIIPKNLEKMLTYVSNIRGHLKALLFFVDQVKSGYEIPVDGKQFSVPPKRLKHIQEVIDAMNIMIKGGKGHLKKTYDPSPELEVFRPLITQAEILSALVQKMMDPAATSED